MPATSSCDLWLIVKMRVMKGGWVKWHICLNVYFKKIVAQKHHWNFDEIHMPLRTQIRQFNHKSKSFDESHIYIVSNHNSFDYLSIINKVQLLEFCNYISQWDWERLIWWWVRVILSNSTMLFQAHKVSVSLRLIQYKSWWPKLAEF